MRPHFVTIGQHTINVSQITRLYALDPHGEYPFTVAIWFANSTSFNLEGDEARQLLAFLAAPPYEDTRAEGPTWRWEVLG